MACRVVHYEVLGCDGKALQRFYSTLFGWNVDANNPMDYGIVGADQTGISGGIGRSPAQPTVTFYVAVPDLNEALAQAEKLGGKTLEPPHRVPDGPMIAKFADPEGNVIGILNAEMS